MITFIPHRFSFGMCAVLVALLPVAASAQPPARSFQELESRVQIGDLVFVVEESGGETKGNMATVSSDSIGLTVNGTRRDFVEGTVIRIDRRRPDSVRNGFVIGFGGGALLGFLAGRAADSPACPRSGIECGQGAMLGTVAGAIWGGVGGWFIDAVTHKREVVYRRPADSHTP
jgi:hypothetical protein